MNGASSSSHSAQRDQGSLLNPQPAVTASACQQSLLLLRDGQVVSAPTLHLPWLLN